jgi:hypothetical protein
MSDTRNSQDTADIVVKRVTRQQIVSRREIISRTRMMVSRTKEAFQD